MAFIKHLPKVSLLILIVFFIFFSCNDKSSNDTSKSFITPEEQVYEVTTQENTNSVSKSVMNDLDSYDSNTGTYIFDSKASELKGLKPGTVALFEAHSLRKIKSVRIEGGKTIIETSFAKLTDYYKNAKISYNTAIEWNNTATSAVNFKMGQPVVTLARPMLGFISNNKSVSRISSIQNESSVKIEQEIRGWKIEFELKPSSNGKLKIKLVAKKERICSIVAEGFISSFTSQANIEIVNGETQHFSYTNEGMEGEIEIKFSAVGLGSEISILEIPATIEKTILVYGIIPVTLRLKANLKIIPEIAVGNSSQVSMKLNYNSNTGFTYNTGGLTPQGSVTNDTAIQTGDSNTATTAIAGVGVGIEFPRFEIGILGNVVVPYLVLNTHASSYLSTGLAGGSPPCHLARLKYEASAGVTMSFFGVGTINNDYKLFKEEKRWVSEGSHCD